MNRRPQLVGVIDLLHGEVVRAVGGHRDTYRPVQSRLCESSSPLDVARAFRREFGIEQLYVADLDAIRGVETNTLAIAPLVQEGFRVSLDAGFRSIADLEAIANLDVEIILAVESLPNHAVLNELISYAGAARVRFSIDLADGVPLAEPSAWRQSHWTDAAVINLAAMSIAAGVERLLVLDLRAVGSQAGPTTTAVCRQIVMRWPHISLWSGGGVRTTDDSRELADAGVDGVLVASSLHDRTLDVTSHFTE